MAVKPIRFTGYIWIVTKRNVEYAFNVEKTAIEFAKKIL